MEWTESIQMPETRVELIENHLRDAIFSGQLKAGERVNEAQIAKNIGISRSPLREAIRKLEIEGLFIIIPQKGTFVTRLTQKDAAELYSLRSILETHAVCRAIENNAYTKTILEMLHEKLLKIQELEKKKEFIEAVKADWAFHLEICRPGDHNLILEILKMLQGRIWLCMFEPTMFYSKPGEQSNIHQQIFDAIQSKDCNAARMTLEKHHKEALEALLQKMQATENHV